MGSVALRESLCSKSHTLESAKFPYKIFFFFLREIQFKNM